MFRGRNIGPPSLSAHDLILLDLHSPPFFKIILIFRWRLAAKDCSGNEQALTVLGSDTFTTSLFQIRIEGYRTCVHFVSAGRATY